MGSYIELNDTLQITTEQGFPADLLNLENHLRGKTDVEKVTALTFEFKNKPSARIYHLPPTRNFLAHNIDGKWLYWGKIIMVEQTITTTSEGSFTSGKYKITEIYNPEYQKQITLHETSPGKSYF
ncbi:MAG TPA: hypothetical protein VEA59_06610 [Patescibacteria group bacterium]|nr:hypothetical protein [Patescibacteria group bacterium]